MPVTRITSENFDQEVVQSGTPVILLFWDQLPNLCLHAFEAVTEMGVRETRVKLGTVNVNNNPKLAVRFGVGSLPEIQAFVAGQPMLKIEQSQLTQSNLREQLLGLIEAVLRPAVS